MSKMRKSSVCANSNFGVIIFTRAVKNSEKLLKYFFFFFFMMFSTISKAIKYHFPFISQSFMQSTPKFISIIVTAHGLVSYFKIIYEIIIHLSPAVGARIVSLYHWPSRTDTVQLWSLDAEDAAPPSHWFSGSLWVQRHVMVCSQKKHCYLHAFLLVCRHVGVLWWWWWVDPREETRVGTLFRRCCWTLGVVRVASGRQCIHVGIASYGHVFPIGRVGTGACVRRVLACMVGPER